MGKWHDQESLPNIVASLLPGQDDPGSDTWLRYDEFRVEHQHLDFSDIGDGSEAVERAARTNTGD